MKKWVGTLALGILVAGCSGSGAAVHPSSRASEPTGAPTVVVAQKQATDVATAHTPDASATAMSQFSEKASIKAAILEQTGEHFQNFLPKHPELSLPAFNFEVTSVSKYDTSTALAVEVEVQFYNGTRLIYGTDYCHPPSGVDIEVGTASFQLTEPCPKEPEGDFPNVGWEKLANGAKAIRARFFYGGVYTSWFLLP